MMEHLLAVRRPDLLAASGAGAACCQSSWHQGIGVASKCFGEDLGRCEGVGRETNLLQVSKGLKYRVVVHVRQRLFGALVWWGHNAGRSHL